MKKAKKTSHDLISHVTELYSSESWDDLIKYFEKYKLSPESNPYASQYHALALFKLNDFEAALSILERIAPFFEDDANIQSLYGAALRRVGKTSEAEERFRLALNIEPESTQIKNNYVNLLIDVGKYSEADILIKEILRADPNMAEAKENQRRLSFLSSSNSNTHPDTELGGHKWSPEDPLESAFADKEVFTNPLNHRLLDTPKEIFLSELPVSGQQEIAFELIQLAKQALKEKNYKLTLKLCSQAKEFLGCNHTLYSLAADSYIALQQFSNAETAYLHCLTLQGPTLSHYINLASLASMRSDFDLAKKYLELASVIDPNSEILSQLSDSISTNIMQSSNKFVFSKWGA